MTAACPVPRANSRAASKRRASNAATSRRPWHVLAMLQHGIVPDDDHQSISRESLALEVLVVEHPAEPQSESVLGKELRDDRVEHAAVLVATRIAIDRLHLRWCRSKRAQHPLLNVRAKIDVLDIQGAHAGACEAGEEGIERAAVVPEVGQERPDERVGLDAP